MTNMYTHNIFLFILNGDYFFSPSSLAKGKGKQENEHAHSKDMIMTELFANFWRGPESPRGGSGSGLRAERQRQRNSYKVSCP